MERSFFDVFSELVDEFQLSERGEPMAVSAKVREQRGKMMQNLNNSQN